MQIYQLTVLGFRSMKGSHWARVKVLVGSDIQDSVCSRGEHLLAPSIVEAALTPWLMAPFSMLQANHVASL